VKVKKGEAGAIFILLLEKELKSKWRLLPAVLVRNINIDGLTVLSQH